MTQVITPQQAAINQYVASGLTVAFNYSFLILLSTDIAVYATPPGQAANPIADLVPTTNYTVSGVGVTGGGQVTFSVAPVNGTIVTLARDMQLAMTTQFNDAQTFNGQSLDNAFQRIVLLLQQMQGNFLVNNGMNGSISRCLQYVVDTYLPSAANNILPLLTNIDNQVWISQGGGIVAAVLQSDNMSTFRSQIASQSPTADGCTLIGYYDANNLAPQTLNTFLNNLPTYITNVVNPILVAYPAPNVTQITATGSDTYIVPTGAKYLRVRGAAGGGGGGGSGTAGATTGGTGGNTTFGAVTATGGVGGNLSGVGGAGGTCTGATINWTGVVGAPGSAIGSSINVTLAGGNGGGSIMFGGGSNDALQATGAGTAGVDGTGGGGSGGGFSATASGNQSGAGGGSGASFETIIEGTLAATYSYSVGVGGTAGALASGGVAGGAGGKGSLIIEAFFI